MVDKRGEFPLEKRPSQCKVVTYIGVMVRIGIPVRIKVYARPMSNRTEVV